MAVASSSSSSAPHSTLATDMDFLNSVEGEIHFFRSLMRARPVGMHRYFHVLAIRNAIYKDSARLVHPDSIWEKLRSCYNLDALEAADAEHENLYTPYKNATPIPIPAPTPSDNLMTHPFFRTEYELPYDEDIAAIVNQRRMRASPSTTGRSTPPPLPTGASPTTAPPATSSAKRPRTAGSGNGTKKRGKSQSKLAGLVGGDSDSSALTQESGDEGQPETPRDSVITATEDGDEDEDEEATTEMREPSPAPSVSPRPTRGRPAKGGTRGGRGRGAGRGTAGTRSTKKRKR